MAIKKLKKLDYRGEVTVLVYMLFGAIAAIVILAGAFLIVEEMIEIDRGTRAFNLPSLQTTLEFGWPIALGIGIWLAGAVIRLIMTGVRAFPLRLGFAPEDTGFFD
jgi:hypothetical protein